MESASKAMSESAGALKNLLDIVQPEKSVDDPDDQKEKLDNPVIKRDIGRVIKSELFDIEGALKENN
jgi:hypothetical protein